MYISPHSPQYPLNSLQCSQVQRRNVFHRKSTRLYVPRTSSFPVLDSLLAGAEAIRVQESHELSPAVKLGLLLVVAVVGRLLWCTGLRLASGSTAVSRKSPSGSTARLNWICNVEGA